MTVQVSSSAPSIDLPAELADKTFEAFVFDWDGTAVPDRAADAAPVRARVEALCAAGVHVFVVSGTHVGNVDGQLLARPAGPGHLYLCLNRGSEVFAVTEKGTTLEWRRVTTDEAERGLDRAAELTVQRLGARGVAAQVVSQRLNRRKIDIIPDPAWADPPKARIGELLDAVTERLTAAGVAGLAEVVAVAAGAAREAGLADPRITSDVKHVEIGLTDKADSARWSAAWLAERGVTGGLVLVAGDEFGPIGGVCGSDSLMLVPELVRAATFSVGVEPGGVPRGVIHLDGGPARFLEVVDAQLERRAACRAPWIDEDAGWVVPLPDQPGRERVVEALGALGNGSAGTRDDSRRGHAPHFVVSGMYTDGADPRLLSGPLWTGLRMRTGPEGERLLDLRTGVLARFHDDTGLRTVRFVSAADPYALGFRAEAEPHQLEGAEPLTDPGDGAAFDRLDRDGARLARTANPGGGGIAMAARDREQVRSGRRTVERLATWTAGDAPSWDEALDRLSRIERAGFDRLLAEHREAWARRWQDTYVAIEGCADDQLASRFALFQLLSAAPDQGEAAVGARGLTGAAYGGHVFWDADVFVLPALAAVRPDAARAMLEYRIRRLPAARAAAAARGLRGARFPWESAADGSDVTPLHYEGRHGKLIPVRTGQHEVHIVADVAWAATEYAAWTGDAAFLAGPGRDLLLDTARYWHSRARRDAAGGAHLDGVIGPDEYHEVVDDNAFTNVMARWNLRRAAALVEEHGGDAAEAAAWRELADAMVDGYDPERHLYEQFAGYWDLEPLLVTDVAPPPVAADLLLGAERVAGSQLIKQADVLMLHHLVPGETVDGSLAADLAHYEPRTAHGSSLSPAIHAALWARAGEPDRALELFRVAARLDLDDLTGTTAGGLHLATIGGVWQALAYGFLGLRPQPDRLDLDPCLPAEWDALALRLRFQGRSITVRASHNEFTIACREPLRVSLRGGTPQPCDPPGRTFTTGRTTP